MFTFVVREKAFMFWLVLIIIVFVVAFVIGIAFGEKSAAVKGDADEDDSPSLIDELIVGAAAAHLLEKGEEHRQQRRREREQRDRELWQWQEATRDRIRDEDGIDYDEEDC